MMNVTMMRTMITMTMMMVMMITTYNEEGLTHTRRVRTYCGSLFICLHSQSTSTWWGDDTMSKVVAFLSTTLHSQLPRCNPQVPCFYCWNYRVVECCWRMKIPTAREMIRKSKKDTVVFLVILSNLTVHKQGSKKVLGCLWCLLMSKVFDR